MRIEVNALISLYTTQNGSALLCGSLGTARSPLARCLAPSGRRALARLLHGRCMSRWRGPRRGRFCSMVQRYERHAQLGKSAAFLSTRQRFVFQFALEHLEELVLGRRSPEQLPML